MAKPSLPARPRLADHAMPRRHFVDGEEVVVVHDARTGDLVRMPPRAWALIEAADGTRDLDGLLLAASQKGELRRPSEIVAVLSDLQAAGLLTDGIDPFAFEPPPDVAGSAAPLDVLPFSLVCDGSGSCCATYSTVRFTRDEAALAAALMPGAQDGRVRRFLPISGSGAQPSVAATSIDGRCGYLAGDGACELHRTHGPGAKPSGCAIYPATFVFDGEAVRVSLGVECACVAKSLGNKGGAARAGGVPILSGMPLQEGVAREGGVLIQRGVPLVAEGLKTRGELPVGAQVAVLPEDIETRTGVKVAREVVVRWSRAVLAAPRPEDAVAMVWALAAKVAEGDLSEAGVRAALGSATAPQAEELRPWIAALCERTANKLESAERWRSARDRVRVASRLLADTAASLKDPTALGLVLGGHGAAREIEAFYVTASLHGHALIGEIPLAHALRDRAVRMLLARALPETAERMRCDDPGREHPLPLVEAMMRAQGVKAYAHEVPESAA